MTSPFDTVYVDLVGPPVDAAWLNAVSLACKRFTDPTTPTEFTATAGQTTFTVPSGKSNLVFVDGVFQTPGVAYTWTTATTLVFTGGIHVGGKVTVL